MRKDYCNAQFTTFPDLSPLSLSPLRVLGGKLTAETAEVNPSIAFYTTNN